MYTLYSYPVSQHSRRVVALLEAAGLDYENKHVAMDKGDFMKPEYLTINPNHQLPTLLDGDIKIHESNAILRYLCLKHDLKDWYPDDLAPRAAVEQWLDWGQCRLGPAVVDIVLNTVFMGEHGDKAAIKRGHNTMTELSPILAAGLEGRNFLAGDQATIADLAIASNITHLGWADATPTEANIVNWLTRVCAIEGFRKTLPQKEAA
jgi:glutathione S-transferase